MSEDEPKPDAPETHRIARVQVSVDVLTWLLESGSGIRVLANGLPKRAACVGAFIDQGTRRLWLHVEHESFEPVQFGDVIPELPAIAIGIIDQ